MVVSVLVSAAAVLDEGMLVLVAAGAARTGVGAWVDNFKNALANSSINALVVSFVAEFDVVDVAADGGGVAAGDGVTAGLVVLDLKWEGNSCCRRLAFHAFTSVGLELTKMSAPNFV